MIGDSQGINVSTVSRIIKRVTTAIVGLRNQHIRMPTTERQIQETHDSAIFTNSAVCHEFETGRYGQACLLGDNGYPLKVSLNNILHKYMKIST